MNRKIFKFFANQQNKFFIKNVFQSNKKYFSELICQIEKSNIFKYDGIFSK